MNMIARYQDIKPGPTRTRKSKYFAAFLLLLLVKSLQLFLSIYWYDPQHIQQTKMFF